MRPRYAGTDIKFTNRAYSVLPFDIGKYFVLFSEQKEVRIVYIVYYTVIYTVEAPTIML